MSHHVLHDSKRSVQVLFPGLKSKKSVLSRTGEDGGADDGDENGVDVGDDDGVDDGDDGGVDDGDDDGVDDGDDCGVDDGDDCGVDDGDDDGVDDGDLWVYSQDSNPKKVFCRGPVCEQWVHQNGHINSYSGSNLRRSL